MNVPAAYSVQMLCVQKPLVALVLHFVTCDVLLFQEAGADGTYVEAPRSIDELKEIAKRQKVIAFCMSLVSICICQATFAACASSQ